jgi:enoyl-CoA hydratase/carnithine racemase
MGLITGLLTFPLAPVRGTVWIAERILEQAERELYDERAIRAQLMEIEAAREEGRLTEEEATRAEDELVERLLAAPTASLGFTKLAVYRGWDRDADAAYELQGLAQHFARQTEDYAEGRRAFAQKRTPRYSGRLPDSLRADGG